jgi:hypothetical protein
MRHLEPVVNQLRRVSAPPTTAHRRAGRPPSADFIQHCRVAAFFAYCDLGGDPEHPELFAWETQDSALQAQARRRLGRDRQGSHTDYYDSQRRSAKRLLPPNLWTGWEEADGETAEAPDYRPIQWALLEEGLQDYLTPDQFWAVCQVHLGGHRVRDLAQAYAAGHPDYQDEDGWRRAEKLIGGWYYNGSRRARERFAPKFHRLLLANA